MQMYGLTVEVRMNYNQVLYVFQIEGGEEAQETY